MCMVPMLTLAQLKILDPVVGLVPVDVMNGLIATKGTAQVLRHHETMLQA